MRELLILAQQESLRTLRRRETFWIFLVSCALLLIAPVALFAIALRTSKFLVPDEWKTPDQLRNVLRAFELLSVLIAAYVWSARSMRSELADGTWILLKQTPIPLGRLLAGRALGVAAMVLAFHSFCFFCIVLFTPFVNISHGTVFLQFIVVWLIGVGLVPDGFLVSLSRVAEARTLLMARLAGLGRLLIAALLVRVTLKPDVFRAQNGVFDVLDAFVASQYREAALPASTLFADPTAAALLLIGWWCLSGLGVWWLCLVRLRRSQ